MNLGEITLLAIAQGLTEFLPVSSRGHLVAARILFGISDASGTAFDAFLHLGTLLAVLVYYWRVWWGMAFGDKRELLAKLAIATVPGAVAGYALQSQADTLLRSPQVVAGGLLVTAAALVLGDIVLTRLHRSFGEVSRASYKDAFLIGLAQVAALVPGVSRSGITIAAARARGLSRKQAATFSFLLSAPIIAGAGLASAPALLGGGMFIGSQLLVGVFLSFLSGLAAIYILLKLVERISFWPFVVYLIGLAAVLFYVG